MTRGSPLKLTQRSVVANLATLDYQQPVGESFGDVEYLELNERTVLPLAAAALASRFKNVIPFGSMPDANGSSSNRSSALTAKRAASAALYAWPRGEFGHRRVDQGQQIEAPQEL